MFDTAGAFASQFTPVEGGYLFYPSKKGGGKLVTAAEYEQLAEGWHKTSGGRGAWKIAGITMLAILFWTAVSRSLSLPVWLDSIIVGISVIAISAWLLWASLAPRRLVRDRPAITPPRPRAELKRQVRAMLSWRLIVFMLFVSGAVFLGSLGSWEQSSKSWAWSIGSAVIFGLYFWLAIQKFRDR